MLTQAAAASGISLDNIQWIPFTANTAAPVQMMCFPYAGGHAGVFRSWAAALDPLAELYGIQPPGRGSRRREPPAARLVDLAADLAAALAPNLHKPFVLFGHSLGATLAFEVARSLRRRAGLSPCHLVVSAQRPPHAPKTDPYRSDLTDKELVQQLSDLNGTPPEILENRELLQLALPPLRADFRLDETYVYVADEPLECPITVFAGRADLDISGEVLKGWQEHTSERLSTVWFDGDHFFINSCERDVLRQLRIVLGDSGVATISPTARRP